MLPLLAVMDVTGLQSLARHADRSLLWLLVPAGLVGTLVGTASFGLLPAHQVAGVVGALTLAFLAQRGLWCASARGGNSLRWAGGLLGVAAGFTSFVAHAGGPPIMAYVLPMQLAPLRFAGTCAVFFAVINASKWIPYAALGLIDARNLATSLLLMPLAPLGVWAGVRLAKRVSPRLFYRLVELGMLATGLKLLWDGLVPG
jgi:uncharacterized protein